MLSTRTLSKFPDLTFEQLAEARDKFLSEFGEPWAVLKCSPEAYIAIRDLFLDEEEDKRQRIEMANENRKFRGKAPYKEPVNHWGTLLGIQIKLDPELPSGEWKFE